MSTKRAEVVALRITGMQRAEAEKAAAALGVSLSEYARDALLERLQADRLRSEVQALAAQVATLGSDLGAELAAIRQQVETLPTVARLNVGQHRAEWLLASVGAKPIPKAWADFWREYETARASGAPLPPPPEA